MISHYPLTVGNIMPNKPHSLKPRISRSKMEEVSLLCRKLFRMSCSGDAGPPLQRLPLPFLQKSIRPQVVTTFELPGCYDMWTVISPQKTEEATVRPAFALAGSGLLQLIGPPSPCQLRAEGPRYTQVSRTGGWLAGPAWACPGALC